MLELHVLGTSSARFAHGRAVSGSVVNTPGGTLLVDCGEGMQQRLIDHNRQLKSSVLQSRTRIAKVRAILLTHGHLDHCWGLLPLLQTMALDGRKDPLLVMGPTTVDALTWAREHPGVPPSEESGVSSTDLAILFQQWQALGSKDESFGFELDWHLFTLDDDMPAPAPVQPIEEVILTVVPTQHGIPACGYQVTQPTREGRFDRDRAYELRLKRGHISRLARGEDIVHDGQELAAVDFRGPPRPPRSLLISGDTVGGIPAFAGLEVAPDVLLHEATFANELQEKATRYNHSTAADAAGHASACGAHVLALTHYSSRIDDTSELIDDASGALTGPTVVHACADGELFLIGGDDILPEVEVLSAAGGWEPTRIT